MSAVKYVTAAILFLSQALKLNIFISLIIFHFKISFSTVFKLGLKNTPTGYSKNSCNFCQIFMPSQKRKDKVVTITSVTA